MPIDYVILAGALAVILVGAELFTNGIEWIAWHLNLGDGAVGSILAAVGTALPETIIPILAIVLGATAEAQDIGIGAIIGSSFMLATLALFVAGASIAFLSLQGRRSSAVNADPRVISRDLGFFILAYGATILAAVLNRREIQLGLALALVLVYLVYVFRTISQDEATAHSLRQLYVMPEADPPHILLVTFQILASLGVIIVGARYFVSSIEAITATVLIPALVFSLLLTPFATELPEKLNSVIWIRRQKDTLALGNITGAMVFQSCILPAAGIILTPWQLTSPALIAAGLGLASATAIYLLFRIRGRIEYWQLMASGLVYFAFLAYALFGQR